MGFRFRRRIKLFPGLWLNASRSGLSASLGVRGATVNLNRKGHQETVGLPGSGLSYRGKRRPIGASHRPLARGAMRKSPRRGFWHWLFFGP